MAASNGDYVGKQHKYNKTNLKEIKMGEKCKDPIHVLSPEDSNTIDLLNDI